MDKTLRSIYLRLDVNMQHLTSKAIAQIIVKLIYTSEHGMKKNEIKDALAKVNEWRHIDSKEVDEILDGLVPQELKLHHGVYSLSKSKREHIRKSIEESVERKEKIIDTFFSRLNSDRDVIREWLTDVSIKFFEVFSDEWISDLMARTNHVVRSEDAIRQLITNRTNSNKEIDSEDKKVLPGRFFDFVNTRDAMVIDYLWEYGTSAFASILIDHAVQRFHHLFISEQKLQLASIDSLGSDGILRKAHVPSLWIFLVPFVLQGDIYLSILCRTIVEIAIVQDSLHNYRIQIVILEETALETTRSVLLELVNIYDRTIVSTCSVSVLGLGSARSFIDAKPCSA